MESVPQAEREKGRSRNLFTGAALAALAACVYVNALGNGFVTDDQAQIVNRVGSGDLMSLRRIFTTDHFGGQYGGYRPVVTLSFALNYLIAGLAPLSHHLVNVMLHAAVTVLAYRVIKALFGREFIAVGAAVLFAVHPVHSEAVAWVSGRADLLAALFFLSAWLLYLRASASTPIRPIAFGTSLVVFALALLSKEHTLLFPVILLLSDVFREENRGSNGPVSSLVMVVSRRWRLYLSYGVLIGLYLAARYLLFGRALLFDPATTLDLRNPLLSVPWYPRVLTAARILLADMGLLVWPAHLSMDYSYNQIPLSVSLFEPDAFLAVSVLLGVTIAAVVLAWRGSIEGFGLLFYLTLIAATANVFTVTHTIRAERLLYLPSLGICLAVAAVVDRLACRLRMQRRQIGMSVLTAAVAAVCLILAIRSVVRNGDWKDPYTLWRSAVQVVPGSAVAHYGFGLSLVERGQVDDAIAEYKEAIHIYPAYYAPRMALGMALIRNGKKEEGLETLRAVVSERPNLADGYLWLGDGLAKARMFDQAVPAFLQALTLKPDMVTAHYLLGSAFLRQGEVEKALSSYLKAVALMPENPAFLSSLSYAYLKLGQPEKAREAVQHALRLSPGLPQALAVVRMLDEYSTHSTDSEESDR